MCWPTLAARSGQRSAMPVRLRDASTHRLPVRAEVDNHDSALKPEMVASFSSIAGDDAAGPAVPVNAVIHGDDTARVFVAGDCGSLTLQTIRTGRASDGTVELVAGLDPQETIVAGGALFIDRAAKGD